MAIKTENPDYITLTSGMRGTFAVYLAWCPDHGGFYEPLWTCDETFRNGGLPAISHAKALAKAHNVEYR